MLEALLALTIFHWLIVICVIGVLLVLIAIFRIEARLQPLEFDSDNLYDHSDKITKVVNQMNDTYTPDIRHLKQDRDEARKRIAELEEEVRRLNQSDKLR